jgi:hypothetical protein
VTEFKTSVRLADDRIDEFQALRFLLRVRPHELAARLVAEGLERYAADPETGPSMREIAESLAAARARRENEQASNVISLHRARRTR